MNSRLYWADQVKAFAIMLMVLCHYGVFNNECLTFIYIFHMPIFFFISGYFDKAKSFSKEVLEKNIKTLIVPYFFFSICAFTICWISPYLHPELYHNDNMPVTFFKAFIGMILMQDWVRSYAFMPLGPLWFLVALFWVKNIFAAICGTVRKDKLNAFLLLVLLCLYSFLAYCRFFSTDSALLAIPIYSIGYLFKRFEIIEHVKNTGMCLLLFCAGAIYLILVGMNNGNVSMDGADYGNSIIMFYINAIIGSLTFIFMFKAINVKWNWLSVVGASTLTILGTHTYINKIGSTLGVLFLNISPNHKPIWFVLPLAIIGIAFGVYCHKLIMNKMPWVLGK